MRGSVAPQLTRAAHLLLAELRRLALCANHTSSPQTLPQRWCGGDWVPRGTLGRGSACQDAHPGFRQPPAHSPPIGTAEPTLLPPARQTITGRGRRDGRLIVIDRRHQPKCPRRPDGDGTTTIPILLSHLTHGLAISHSPLAVVLSGSMPIPHRVAGRCRSPSGRYGKSRRTLALPSPANTRLETGRTDGRRDIALAARTSVSDPGRS
jgi:hypothetical protein